MTHRIGHTIIIGLGGSIVHPDEIDVVFLKKFHAFVRKILKKRMRIIIVVGGGKLSRRFQNAAEEIHRVQDEDKDWIGIHATRLNAQLLRTIFRDVVDPVVWDNRAKVRKPAYPVTIASGWRPGWSTDYVAVAIASALNIPEIVIAGKPAYVYTHDNVKYEHAKPIESLTWQEYQKLIPPKWSPGLHAPVDPVAATFARKKKITAIILNGKNLENFDCLLRGKEFQGTIIA